MKTIICDYCGNKIETLDSQPISEDCPNCNQPLEIRHIENIQQAVKQESSLDGLTLTYLKTGEQIRIPHAQEFVLGREAVGRELLNKIDYISRTHCKIEVLDNQYVITDIGSTNGTFIGQSKIDCKRYPRQRLSDGEIVILGREPFQVRINYTAIAGQEDVSLEIEDEAIPSQQANKQQFECQDCHAYASDVQEFVCPNCGSYNG